MAKSKWDDTFDSIRRLEKMIARQSSKDAKKHNIEDVCSPELVKKLTSYRFKKGDKVVLDGVEFVVLSVRDADE